jgi:2-keto-4-pentenoate hydratase/2-oxohepta-3-ene-1,7-dioic acid hydratase in catechol pathway
MRLSVAGELRQKQNTGSMIYNIRQQVAHLSTVMTLMPGDLIATGSCAAVGGSRSSCSLATLCACRSTASATLRTGSSRSPEAGRRG